MLSALVLAAGKSERMGVYIKALLPIDGTTFIGKIISSLSKTECGELLVVLGADQEKIQQMMENERVKILTNSDWKTGQLSSLKVGIKNLSPQSEGMLFTLVDHPLVKLQTYCALIDVWKNNKHRIIVPTYNGRGGHPTIFPKRLYSKLLEEILPEGARSIIREEKSSVVYVPVEDQGILKDIDSPKDFEQFIGEW